MKFLISRLLCFFAVIAIITACDHSSSKHAESKNEDSDSIRAVTQAYQQAYNQQDVDKLAPLWASDAIFENPVTGKYAEGREEIVKLYQARFDAGEKKQAEITIKNITFPSPEEAIQRGVMKVTSSDDTVERLAFQVSFVKENGKWLINGINEIQLQDSISQFEHLKDLDWMIGKWTDRDPNVDITFDTKWDKNQNFITQNFTMQVLDQDALSGYQIIGWDAAENVIKSWVFDSDGGVGMGTWIKDGKSWYADMSYTLSDGTKASAKNVYTPIDANSYTYASMEREMDGQILPDVDPVKVVKTEMGGNYHEQK